MVGLSEVWRRLDLLNEPCSRMYEEREPLGGGGPRIVQAGYTGRGQRRGGDPHRGGSGAGQAGRRSQPPFALLIQRAMSPWAKGGPSDHPAIPAGVLAIAREDGDQAFSLGEQQRIGRRCFLV